MKNNDELVQYLREQGWLKTERVTRAFKNVDRSLFVLPSLKQYAYEDMPLPILRNQTISQPLVVAVALEALDVFPGMRVLEVGAGSGYQAALLSEIVGKNGVIYSVERIEELCEYARERLTRFSNVVVIQSDGSKGLPDKAPFDRVIVTAGCPKIPKPLVEQLKPGGKMIAPVEAIFGQELLLIEKGEGGRAESQSLLPVAFVPLIGEHGFDEKQFVE